jgi:hypothetical protein
MSERERLERDLRRQAAELASSAERAHLARELHDSVTQALFAMTLVSRSIELLLDRDPAAALARFAELRELQREALAEMRSLIFELRPGSIDAMGARALKRGGRGVAGGAASADVDARSGCRSVWRRRSTASRRLHNIVRYAGAQSAELRLRARPAWAGWRLARRRPRIRQPASPGSPGRGGVRAGRALPAEAARWSPGRARARAHGGLPRRVWGGEWSRLMLRGGAWWRCARIEPRVKRHARIEPRIE